MARLFVVDSPALAKRLHEGGLPLAVVTASALADVMLLHPTPADVCVAPDGVVATNVDLCRSLIGQGVWFLVGYATDDTRAVQLATQIGAKDVIALQASAPHIAFRLVRHAEAARNLVQAPRVPRKSDIIVGGGAWHKALLDRITMVAQTDAAVAIFGESGTGKELVARTIHRASRRKDGPFVVVNCAAIPATLIEDELFGHVRGAFTDATRDREGLIAAAHGGTLFLDEIGEVPLASQAKLLRVLQTHEVRRLGDDRDVAIDVRVITATNRDLLQACRDGTFREDLYYRICVVPVELPPLRARLDDIPLLVHHLIVRYRSQLGRQVTAASPSALAALRQHRFAGNIRELENMVHAAMVMANGDTLVPSDFGLQEAVPVSAAATDAARMPDGLDMATPFKAQKQAAIAAFEKRYIVALLTSAHGNVAAAARLAGLDRKAIWLLATRYGLDPATYRAGSGGAGSGGAGSGGPGSRDAGSRDAGSRDA